MVILEYKPFSLKQYPPEFATYFSSRCSIHFLVLMSHVSVTSECSNLSRDHSVKLVWECELMYMGDIKQGATSVSLILFKCQELLLQLTIP